MEKMTLLARAMRDAKACAALEKLKARYTIADAGEKIVLTAKQGNMKLFFYSLEDIVYAEKDTTDPSWQPNVPPKRPDSGGKVEPEKDLSIEILQQEISRLKKSGRIIIQQREEWRERALAAEKIVETSARNSASENSLDQNPYSTLKKFLARNFHPDNASGSNLEKIVRAEIFKEVWAEIDRIDRQNK